MRFQLTPRSMTLDKLELYKLEFLENFAGFRRFRSQQQLNEWRWTRTTLSLTIVSDNVVSYWMHFSTLCSLLSFVFDFFDKGLHTFSAVARLS